MTKLFLSIFLWKTPQILMQKCFIETFTLIYTQRKVIKIKHLKSSQINKQEPVTKLKSAEVLGIIIGNYCLPRGAKEHAKHL